MGAAPSGRYESTYHHKRYVWCRFCRVVDKSTGAERTSLLMLVRQVCFSKSYFLKVSNQFGHVLLQEWKPFLMLSETIWFSELDPCRFFSLFRSCTGNLKGSVGPGPLGAWASGKNQSTGCIQIQGKLPSRLNPTQLNLTQNKPQTDVGFTLAQHMLAARREKERSCVV